VHLNKLLFSILPEGNYSPVSCIPGCFHWQKKLRLCKNIRNAERWGISGYQEGGSPLAEPNGRKNAMSGKTSPYPGENDWEASAYHKHFKRLVKNLAEE
jgi:hypothetical protein